MSSFLLFKSGGEIIKTETTQKINNIQLGKISKWGLDKNKNVKNFKLQIKDYNKKLLPSGVCLIVLSESKCLKYANINNNPLIINQGNIRKIYNKHSNISHRVIENLDIELNNSVLAMDSLTRKNSRVVVLNKFSSKGNPIIVTISLNKTNAKIKVNEVTSVYDKKEFQNFIDRTINHNKKIYINEKTEQWLLRNGLQLSIRFTDYSISS